MLCTYSATCLKQWVGDDDPESASPPAFTGSDGPLLATASGTRCYFMRGNRDLLIARGPAFRASTGITVAARIRRSYRCREAIQCCLATVISYCTDDVWPISATAGVTRSNPWVTASFYDRAALLASRHRIVFGLREVTQRQAPSTTYKEMQHHGRQSGCRSPRACCDEHDVSAFCCMAIPTGRANV